MIVQITYPIGMRKYFDRRLVFENFWTIMYLIEFANAHNVAQKQVILSAILQKPLTKIKPLYLRSANFTDFNIFTLSYNYLDNTTNIQKFSERLRNQKRFSLLKYVIIYA